MKIIGPLRMGLAILILAACHAESESVLTYHNDNARTGANTHETTLTPANVNTNSFGLLTKYDVDGYVYGQPLYVHGLAIPGHGTRNVVFVATANNSVYAFDADGSAGPDGGLLWHDDLGGGIDVAHRHEFGGRYHNNVYQDMLPQVGITGTPVIDPVSQTLYVDAFTRTEGDAGPSFHHKIHALNLIDGSERPFSPVEVAASAPGTGIDSSNGVVTFNPRQQMQRPALTLSRGVLYVAYGSAADTDLYHGWILGYDAGSLRLLTNQVFNTTPNATRAQFGSHAGEGALWMGGDGLCVDADNNLFFEVANGSFDADPSLGNGVDYGDSFMKLSTAGGQLSVADFFTPFNEAQMQADDADFGSGGPVLLPDEVGSRAHPHLIVGGDKSSTMYLADRDHMGHYHPHENQQLVQEVSAGVGAMFSTPAYFNFHLYYQGVGGVMKSFLITNGLIVLAPESATRTSFGGFGTTPSVSANGTSQAIVWTIQSDGAVIHQPAILHAYNATNLSQELYNSSQLPARDNPGNAVKMSVPTVADGKVFVGAQASLAIFGNGIFLPAPAIAPAGGNFNNSTVVTLTDVEPDTDIYYTLDGTTPTTRSRHYRTPLTITNSLTIRALAAKPGAVNSGVASAAFVNTAASGGGDGLHGDYWTNFKPANLTNLTLGPSPGTFRTDACVNFDWRGAAPDAPISPENLFVLWSGSVQPQYTGPYELAVASRGGFRLWLNGRILIDAASVGDSIVTNQAAVQMNAQQFYSIALAYANGTGGVIQLLWRRPGEAYTVIPKSQLYSSVVPTPAIHFVNPVNEATFAASASVTVGVEARSTLNQIATVEFFANGKSLGTLDQSIYAPTYALTTTGLERGRYTLTAVATDGSGLSSTSAPINITVNAGSGLPYGLTSREKLTPYLKMPATFGDAVPTLLSGTGVFGDLTSRTPAAGLIPYRLNAPMWSDGATESDYLAVPNRGDHITPDEQLRFRPAGFWKFPDGTVFVKNLDLAVDEIHPNAPRRRLETQILVRDDNGAVYGVTYKWRPDNSDADLVTAGVSEDIAVTNRDGVHVQSWYFASPADCLTCHTPGAGYVLGVNTRQLNGNFPYTASGHTDNQIRTLNRLGLFSPAIDESKIAGFAKLAALTNVTESLAERARSYLDVNCAQCHRPGGVGNYDARYDTPSAAQNMINVPAAVTLGLKDARIVKAADTDHSVLYQRITSVVPTVKMPPLAHNLVDVRARQTISDWINSLP